MTPILTRANNGSDTNDTKSQNNEMITTREVPMPRRKRYVSHRSDAGFPKDHEPLQRIPEILGGWIAGRRRCCICRATFANDAQLAKHLIGLHIAEPYCHWFTGSASFKSKRLGIRLLHKYSRLRSVTTQRACLLTCHYCDAFTTNDPHVLGAHLAKTCSSKPRLSERPTAKIQKQKRRKGRKKTGVQSAAQIQAQFDKRQKDDINFLSDNSLAVCEVLWLSKNLPLIDAKCRILLNSLGIPQNRIDLSVGDLMASTTVVSAGNPMNPNSALVTLDAVPSTSNETNDNVQSKRSTNGRCRGKRNYPGRGSIQKSTKTTNIIEPITDIVEYYVPQHRRRKNACVDRYFCRLCQILYRNYQSYDLHLKCAHWPQLLKERDLVKTVIDESKFKILMPYDEQQNDYRRFDPIDGSLIAAISESERFALDLALDKIDTTESARSTPPVLIEKPPMLDRQAKIMTPTKLDKEQLKFAAILLPKLEALAEKEKPPYLTPQKAPRNRKPHNVRTKPIDNGDDVNYKLSPKMGKSVQQKKAVELTVLRSTRPQRRTAAKAPEIYASLIRRT